MLVHDYSLLPEEEREKYLTLVNNYFKQKAILADARLAMQAITKAKRNFDRRIARLEMKQILKGDKK